MDRHQFTVPTRRQIRNVVEIRSIAVFLALQMTASLRREASSRRVDEDAAHHLRRRGKEVRTVLPVSPVDIYQPQKRLVDESRAFERVARAFVSHVPSGGATQVI